MSNKTLEDLVQKLKDAQNVSVLTGAGVSAESGIKTFRDPDGLWAKFNPQELASIDGFMSNPELVWEWYMNRVDIVNNSTPNDGHFALSKLQSIIKDFSIITQNVDGLHQKAGSVDVIELHGSIVKNKCFDCGKKYDGDIDTSEKKIPRCKSCNGLIRPDVVWFGEMLPANAIRKAQQEAEKSDVFFSIGTSAEVFPAADLPHIAKQNGAFLVEINPNNTVLSKFADLKVADTSANALPTIVEELKKVI